MASCNNAGATLLYGHTMPSNFGQLSSYRREIESNIVSVLVKTRKVPNGPCVKRKFQVNKKLAGNLTAIFDEIFNNYPNIAVNDYIGGYCFRAINNPSSPGSSSASIHSLGAAIDVNYNLNGFIPPDGKPDSTYVMRTTHHPIVQTFLRHGWSWGGAWNGKRKDYMHFEFISGDSKYLDGQYVSNNVDSSAGQIVTDYGGTSGYDNSSFSGGGCSASNYSFPVSPNTVYTLSSNGEKDNVIKLDDGRKNDFEALRNNLLSNMIQTGRTVIKSPELYSSSILKSGQSAKQEIT